MANGKAVETESSLASKGLAETLHDVRRENLVLKSKQSVYNPLSNSMLLGVSSVVSLVGKAPGIWTKASIAGMLVETLRGSANALFSGHWRKKQDNALTKQEKLESTLLEDPNVGNSAKLKLQEDLHNLRVKNFDIKVSNSIMGPITRVIPIAVVGLGAAFAAGQKGSKTLSNNLTIATAVAAGASMVHAIVNAAASVFWKQNKMSDLQLQELKETVTYRTAARPQPDAGPAQRETAEKPTNPASQKWQNQEHAREAAAQEQSGASMAH